ncbi:MAG: acetate/propionate family kinase [Pseudonocardia sp.]|mgnify:CR=1 FL=1|uniref:acetate/propionate family kinase n=1 Tax=unclassified Pseudonocardia TaxID=2619320 RepID=UPI00086E8ECA|nr:MULTISPECIES: acetate/propionate family kinase [unclassified Pseudonocardia]MBN9112465.1 acetate/propionate family kinase [Pseudonocardia sp.]ODU27368.1 MAG: acetate kinase [Pseudonocardia sp. SCN 72-51]ODV09011.1 MAG: acetate kinase [Pseudonocardia sp. SCN 73-27]
MRVLVVNAGSSSLKLRLLGPDDEVERTADIGPGADLDGVVGDWPRPDVVGHRVVHGGTRFTDPVVIDTGVRKELEGLSALAPLHQPKSLAGLDAVTDLLPDVPAVACFDTAFHTTIPDAAATYAVPREWRERYTLRRYGFHGLSHAWCSARVAELTGARRLVTAHLGAGASLTAVLDGHSVDTTMGFTPLEGLVMATRSGSVDPGLVLWLEEHEHLSPHEVAETLEKRSGLAALAGTPDMREVLSGAGRGEPDAVLALDVYVHRLAAGIAAMAAAAGGLEALAFTGGVGEHASEVRARAAERLAFLGVAVDPTRNDTTDGEITLPGALVRTFVVAAREDLEIARGTRAAMR